MIRLGEEFYQHIDNYKKVFSKSTRNYDPNQIDLLQEECSELIQALSKLKRGKQCAKLGIIEEMSHVLISINLVADVLGIKSEQINNYVEEKDKILRDILGE